VWSGCVVWMCGVDVWCGCVVWMCGVWCVSVVLFALTYLLCATVQHKELKQFYSLWFFSCSSKFEDFFLCSVLCSMLCA
jgi:hypothetical protein